MSWWLWLLLGFALLISELLFPSGFFLFFFGLAGLVLGTLTLVGLVVSFSFAWLLFFVISVGLSLLVRQSLNHSFKWSGDAAPLALEGDEVLIVEDISPGAVGGGELRGVNWRVRNGSGEAVIRGSRHCVMRVEGITLVIG